MTEVPTVSTTGRRPFGRGAPLEEVDVHRVELGSILIRTVKSRTLAPLTGPAELFPFSNLGMCWWVPARSGHKHAPFPRAGKSKAAFFLGRGRISLPSTDLCVHK